MQLLLCAEDSEAELRSELLQAWPSAQMGTPAPLLVELNSELEPGRRWPHLVFARQWLPNARALRSESIRSWAHEIFSAVAGILPEDQPWLLHIEPHYGAQTVHHIGARAWHTATRRGAKTDGGPVAAHPPAADIEAGRHRCHLIRQALMELLQKKRRHLLRQLWTEPRPFSVGDSLVQLLLTEPERGYLSVAPAPVPLQQCHLISPFPKGNVPLASDKSAPSRAFAKLVEAEWRLGRSIQPNETCVDLGASPGSWTYVAVQRGARVTAVDRSALRQDLMESRQVEFQPGDAFRFEPKQPVDWLLCDVIAAPERNAQLLLEWLRQRWCRHFVVTLKLRDAASEAVLTELKQKLPSLAKEFFITRLSANKKEVCAFGSAAG